MGAKIIQFPQKPAPELKAFDLDEEVFSDETVDAFWELLTACFLDAKNPHHLLAHHMFGYKPDPGNGRCFHLAADDINGFCLFCNTYGKNPDGEHAWMIRPIWQIFDAWATFNLFNKQNRTHLKKFLGPNAFNVLAHKPWDRVMK